MVIHSNDITVGQEDEKEEQQSNQLLEWILRVKHDVMVYQL